MRVSIALRAALLLMIAFAGTALRSDANCPDCDCSHFPIADARCIDCCFSLKGTVISTAGTSVTVAPVPEEPKRPPKTFRIKKSTKVNGKLEAGAVATVYYHQADGENIATRIDGLGFVHGLVVPANLPAPPDTCERLDERLRARGILLPPIPRGAMRIFFGNSEAYSTDDRFVVWKIGDDDTLVLQRMESGMSVSLKVRGPEGRLIAQIVDNEFFINPNNAFQIKDAGSNSLTVYDAKGQRIFDLQFLNPNTIKVLGDFFGPSGEEIRVGEDEQVFTSHGATVVSRSSCFGGGAGSFELSPTGIAIH